MQTALNWLSCGDLQQLAIRKVGANLQEKHTKWRTERSSPMVRLFTTRSAPCGPWRVTAGCETSWNPQVRVFKIKYMVITVAVLFNSGDETIWATMYECQNLTTHAYMYLLRHHHGSMWTDHKQYLSSGGFWYLHHVQCKLRCNFNSASLEGLICVKLFLICWGSCSSNKQ